MEFFILTGYELLTVLFPFFIVFALLTKIRKRNNRESSLSGFIFTFVFAVYIFGVFHFTSSGTLFDLLIYGSQIHSGGYNFIPFSNEIDTVAYLQNILLFIPLGFLLPLIWPIADKLKYALLSGFSFSLLIEISQIFNHRAADVDDLIMNTTGALLGYFTYKLFTYITGWRHKRRDYIGYEPLIYISAMFLGRFLTYNEFGLVRILYNF